MILKLYILYIFNTPVLKDLSADDWVPVWNSSLVIVLKNIDLFSQLFGTGASFSSAAFAKLFVTYT